MDAFSNDEEVFQKCYEIVAESRWMLRLVSEMVVGAVVIAWVRFQLADFISGLKKGMSLWLF